MAYRFIAGTAVLALFIPFVLSLEAAAQTTTNLDERLFAEPSDTLLKALQEKRFESMILGAAPNDAPDVPYETYVSKDGLWSMTNVLNFKLAPGLGEAEVDAVLAENGLALESAIPEYGIISARAPLGDQFSPELNVNGWLDATASVIGRYADDPRILSVTPTFGLPTTSENSEHIDAFGLSTLDVASEISGIGQQEEEDWGIGDIEAKQLWSRYEAPIQRNVAVFDTGFGLHEDIAFIDGVVGARGDHGNHVAGILCGLHNQKGFRGVVPYCGVRAKVHDLWLDPSQPHIIPQRISIFQSVIESFRDMVDGNRQVAVFNVSLGYNWYQLKALDPDFEFVDNESLKLVVETQGRFLYQVLEQANAHGIPIVSAAGNDSRDLDNPFDARWASPFNYAALTACEARDLCNGVVVEAHDPEGKLAIFSNKGGNLSCPGVNIKSAIANTAAGASANGYGVMSGTSMASPYCAGGLVLLSTLLPKRPIKEIIDCVAASPSHNSFGTPMMRLAKALTGCGG